MVYVRCCHCGSELLMKDGFSPKGKQRYRCRGCGRRIRENPDTGYSPAFQEQMLRALNEKSSLRGLERAHGVSRHTLSSWLKKRPEDAGGATGPAQAVS